MLTQQAGTGLKFNKRQLQKEQTQQRILNSTHQLFLSEGFSSLKTSTIAKLAGVSEGSIFAHFGDINRLFAAVSQIQTESYVVIAKARLDGDMPVDDKVAAFSNAFMSCFGGEAGMLMRYSIFGTVLDGRKMDVEIASLIEFMVEILQTSIQRGELNSKTEARVLAQIWYSVLMSNIVVGLRSDSFDVDLNSQKVKTCMAALLAAFR